MFDFFDIGSIGLDDMAVAAMLTDPELTDYSSTTDTPIDAIKRERSSRTKGGALVVQDSRAKRLAEEALRRKRNSARVENIRIRERPAREIVRDINLARFGRRAAIRAGAAGLTGLAINAPQGDSKGNLLQNPLTEAAVLTAGGAGLGGLAGIATTPVRQTMPLAYPRSGGAYVPGGQAVRSLTPVEVVNARRMRGVRGGRIGAAAGALLALTNQLRNNDPGQQNVYL